MIGIMSKCGLVKLWLEEFDIAIFKLLNDTDRCCASLSDEQVQQVINSTSSETINN